jgi:hypothetical protein
MKDNLGSQNIYIYTWSSPHEIIGEVKLGKWLPRGGPGMSTFPLHEILAFPMVFVWKILT